MSRLRRVASIWCLAAMCMGGEAQAKSIIAYPVVTQSNSNLIDAFGQSRRNLRLVTSVIRATGGSYALVQNNKTKSEWIRAGYMVWNMGNTTPASPSPGAYREQFDATIVFPQIDNTGTGFLKVDSLARRSFQGAASSSSDAAKPLLFLADNAALIGAGDPFSSSSDSTWGATARDGGPGKAYHFANDKLVAVTHAYVAGALGVGEEADTRRILFANVPQADYRLSNGTNTGATVGCRFCDSLITYAATDTCLLWDRMFNKSITNASVEVVAMPWGAGSAVDSVTNAGYGAANPPTEGDLSLILAALAHLDSLSGHKVLGDRVIRIAPVVYGALSRGDRHSWNWNKSQGINNADTSSFYAYLDSLNALGISITFAVNPDSAATYARDVIKLKAITAARFTPQVWDGINDTTLTAYAGFPKDIFGRYNRRAAFGDSSFHFLCNGGSDSSIYWQLARAKSMVDSIFGGRTSTVLAAPADDWSPLNLDGRGAAGLATWSRIRIDSVIYAMQRAGFTGIIADAQDPDANATKTNAGPSKLNPRGYYNMQGLYNGQDMSGGGTGQNQTSSVNGNIIRNDSLTTRVRDFKILCHTGFTLTGGRSQCETYKNTGGPGSVDSSSAFDVTRATIYAEIARIWSGALLDFDNSYDTWQYDNIGITDPRVGNELFHRRLDLIQGQGTQGGMAVRHGNIARLSCADLSGASGATIVPAATMYHVLKAVNNGMIIINRLAGRTVVAWGYPEDIRP